MLRPKNEPPDTSGDEIEWAELIESLTPNDRRAMLELMRSLSRGRGPPRRRLH